MTAAGCGVGGDCPFKRAPKSLYPEHAIWAYIQMHPGGVRNDAFIITWLFCGFIATAIAAAKKLNVAAWLFLGAALGVFALILVLFQARAPPIPWSAGADAGGRGRRGGGGRGGGGPSGCGGGSHGGYDGAGGGCGGGCGGGGS